MSDEPDIPPELMEQVEEMEDDESIDFEQESRHKDDGWVKMYIECPECHVPMARTTVQSTPLEHDLAYDAQESVHRCVCPQCNRIATRVQVKTVTAEYGELDEAYGEITDDG